MKVYALVGPSGTGKSHRSALLAHRKGIEYIIDDGLLIKGNDVLAGRSAKRETTKMAATKVAIFSDPEHARQVREVLERITPPQILILGISERMIQQIASTLNIPQPESMTHIEDIASPREISQALEARVKQNRHVIPIPTFAIEKDFPGYLLENIRAFFLAKSKSAHSPPPKALEHTIVRPLYSSLGNYFLSEHVIEQITSYVAEQKEEIARVKKSRIQPDAKGLLISLELTLYYGTRNIPSLLESLQREIKQTLESLTGFQVSRIDMHVRHLIVDQEDMRAKEETYKTKPQYFELQRH
jgi:uncharacterized alkaline shock family protein YloU/adenylate kinase family enzyme